jgi:homopolymeric O-antigen transport system permease protein
VSFQANRRSAVGSDPPRVIIDASRSAFDWLEIWRFRELLRTLTERDIRLRYRQTALGIVWVILQPLAASLIFAVVFGLFAKLPSGGAPYLPFVFAAMLPWNLLSGGVQRGGISLIANANLVTKIYFPRAIIPIASVAGVLLDLAVATTVMLGLMLMFGISAQWTLLAVPGLVFITILIAVAVSLIASSLSVHYRDFSYALPFILQVWLYASPVVYSSSLIPSDLQLVYGLNPMVGVIDGFRWAIFGGPAPTATVVESVIVAGVLLVAAAIVFERVERSFADAI